MHLFGGKVVAEGELLQLLADLTLLVLSGVASALREEERLAWQCLIRVLGYEINNSLIPIKSIADSLRARLPTADIDAPITCDFRQGLTVIEERAAFPNSFLQAYQQFIRLPPPTFELISFQQLLGNIVPLESRLTIQLQPGPPIRVFGDPDQLQQLLINLIRNAVEAALSADTLTLHPCLVVTWVTTSAQVVLQIRDNEPGLINPANLFVPFYIKKPAGSGIGLVLAQQIAAAHKDSLTVLNNVTSGCTAELRLPLEPLVPAERG